jgi:ubiquinone/menaquinone biosynthesis C-methylase UbiE
MHETLYDRIGGGYDETRRADSKITARLVDLLDLRSNGAYLDLACGTGNYTAALAARGGSWTGVDNSHRMLASARTKSSAVRWVCADAARLPCASRAFAGAMVVLALHHFPSLSGALAEVERVIEERVVLFTSTREQMMGYWLREFFPAMMDRAIRQMPARSEILAALANAHLRLEAIVPYFVSPDLEDLFLYAGKHRPRLYLDERVRRGISSFASLAAADEVARGVERLAAAVESGDIDRVIRAAHSVDGDYSFVVAAPAR